MRLDQSGGGSVNESKTFSASESGAARRMLRSIAWTIITVAIPLVLLMIPISPQYAARWILIVVLLGCVSAIELALLHRGLVRLPAWFLVVTMWTLLTWMVWTGGGVAAPSIGGQLLVVAFAGMMLGERAGVIALLVSIATVGALVYAELAGVIPTPVVHTPGSRGIVIVTYLVVLMLLQRLVMRAFGWTRARAARELAQRAEAEERLRNIIENAPFGAVAFEVDAEGRLVVSNANLSAVTILGVSTDLLGTPLESVIPSLAYPAAIFEIRHIALSGGTYHMANVTYEHGTGPILLDLNFFQTDQGKGAVFFSDVTEQRHAEVKIRHMAFHDSLTSLPNRELLRDRLGIAMANAVRSKSHVGLLFLDLDDFKPINDRFGHTVGDALLVAVAQRLKRSARAGDTVARIGGDEFTVLVPSVSSREELEVVAHKIVSVMHEPFEVDDHTIRVTVSAGVAMTDGGAGDSDTLMEEADAAMYRMKNAGRDGYRLSVTLEDEPVSR